MAEASRRFIVVEAAGTGGSVLSGILPGRIAFRPQAMAAIGSPVTARVLSVDVRPGEVVRAGSPLMTLQSADVAAARAELNQALARNAAAEDLLRRQNEMIRKGIGLEVEHFSAATALREARAELERARHAVELFGSGKGDHFVLRAPANGTVLSIKASTGSVVSPGDEALAEIGDPDRLWVIVDIPENDIGKIAAGRSADVYIPGTGARLEAVIDGMGQVVSADQRRVPVYLAFRGRSEQSGRSNHLSAGMLAEVQLNMTDDAIRLNLPATAVLIKEGGQQIVYVQRADGSYESRSVRTGNSYGNRVIILEGVQAGEKVVVKGALLLDGAAEQLL
ncbi:efflux RND transporter periplasmic adaptor subunit [Nitrosomonas sp.]|uniref:efflux RND transporter periplasmic adaptor subunit n=1 Tax=Nitrosomonas sp. TaxID=42353 RepID=UPI0025DE8D90|nr:efflux RND transporter periplasmic adaptor subunit [Nitrosomonas sp.]MCC6917009.1 efflux RND transporter periplasmic adaptor subunit [Nitrosomonas sp.]